VVVEILQFKDNKVEFWAVWLSSTPKERFFLFTKKKCDEGVRARIASFRDLAMEWCGVEQVTQWRPGLEVAIIFPFPRFVQPDGQQLQRCS
jgi:hypothetical protein